MAKGEAPGSPVLKQVVVHRDPPLLLVFNVVSCGRVWYRTLVFTSDADRSLHAPPAPPTPPDAGGPPLPPSRGNPMAHSPPGPSLRILRNLNAELGEQMLVPTRFLLGLLPDALLESYTFWQSASPTAGVHAGTLPLTFSLSLSLTLALTLTLTLTLTLHAELLGFENGAARAAALTHTRLRVELPPPPAAAPPPPPMPTLPHPLGAAAAPPPPAAVTLTLNLTLT